MGRCARLSLACVLIAFSACAAPVELVFVNRSERAISLAPDITIPACSSAAFGRADIDGLSDAVEKWAMGLLEWPLPSGAVRFERGIAGPPIGAPKPVTIIVSGSAEPQTIYGSVPESQLPPCLGDPIDVAARPLPTGTTLGFAGRG